MPGQGDLALAEFAEAILKIGYQGFWSQEIFKDRFRAGSASGVAVDGHRSLKLMYDTASRTAPTMPPARFGDMWVADIVYFPLETRLLSAEKTSGCKTLDGRRMAFYQTAKAFDIFTGAQADRARMLASFDAFPLPQAA